MAVILFIFIIFPCHCAVYMYKIMILQKPQPISPKFRIDPTVVMIGLEKCSITSACQQWLCHSGEWAVAREPLVFLISAQKHRLWVLVRTASVRQFWRVPTIYVLSRNMKNSRFLSENFQFLVMKFSIYLNRGVFVMKVVSIWWKSVHKYWLTTKRTKPDQEKCG